MTSTKLLMAVVSTFQTCARGEEVSLVTTAATKKQQQGSCAGMLLLRHVGVDSQNLMVHRCGKWVKLSGTDLLPGDVVSIGCSSGQNGKEKSVPADMLISPGSAIVNEAILTGEPAPSWKVFFCSENSRE
ncbi:hypothetical protein K1719_006268 [Acacia pycnantha]|nr:hypothetical protein K1719_006268 [Acacia pycnantha]